MITTSKLIRSLIRLDRDVSDLVEEAEERAENYEAALWVVVIIVIAFLL
jgi:hypothetical protein